jgi:S-disulfanyl-L-cysteine oxidoreductase SoxD
MCWLKKYILGIFLLSNLILNVHARDFGRSADPEEIKLWDIDVRPDGKGLLAGTGSVTHGKKVYQTNCLACHGEGGIGGIKGQLAGGIGSLTSEKPLKTVGSYWPYATTLFDYIQRAMPYQAPGTLSTNDTYAVTAYILNLNGIIANDVELNRNSLPKIRMPNRDGFVVDKEFIQFMNSM